MRPLGEKASKIFDLTFYESNYIEAHILYEQLINPFDKVFSGLFVSYFDIILDDKKNLSNHTDELEKEIEVISDPFLKLVARTDYYMDKGFLNIGLMTPYEDYPKGKEYFEKGIQILNNDETLISESDPWIQGILRTTKYLLKLMIPRDINQRILYLKEIMKFCSKMPSDGKQVQWYYCTILGIAYTNIGEFQNASEMFDFKPNKINLLFIVLNSYEKARLSFIQGNIAKAIKFSEMGLEEANKNTFNWGVSFIKNSLAHYYAEKGENQRAKQLFLECLISRKTLSNPFATIQGYYNLIRFLTNYYQLTNNPSLLKEAKEHLKEAEDYSQDFIENINVKNYLKIMEAVILKFGRIYDKSKAYMTLKEMANYYSRNQISVHLKLDIIELLIEEAKSNSSNQETLDEIIKELDNLIEQIAKKSILYTPKGAILKYTQHQILVSRYYFYIKGETQEALITLEKAMNEVNNYDLPELQRKIEIEIDNMNNQVKMWSNQTIQERFRKIEIDDYFKQALQIQALSENLNDE